MSSDDVTQDSYFWLGEIQRLAKAARLALSANESGAGAMVRTLVSKCTARRSAFEPTELPGQVDIPENATPADLLTEVENTAEKGQVALRIGREDIANRYVGVVLWLGERLAGKHPDNSKRPEWIN